MQFLCAYLTAYDWKNIKIRGKSIQVHTVTILGKSVKFHFLNDLFIRDLDKIKFYWMNLLKKHISNVKINYLSACENYRTLDTKTFVPSRVCFLCVDVFYWSF